MAMQHHRTIIQEKIRESLTSVLPITLIVLVLSFSIAPIPSSTLMAFVIGAVLLILGMALFTLGAETAMTPIGERIGAQLTKSQKLWFIVFASLLIGFVITISEPDLQVLAAQVPMIENMVLICTIAVGVGVFLVIAMLRILFGIALSHLLIVFYAIVFAIAAFTPIDFLAIAFDSGGVTTGPMTVPFIMALGIGVSAVRSDKSASNDSFGLVALCSVGPILSVLVLGILYSAEGGSYTPVVIPDVSDTRELWMLFGRAFPHYLREVLICLAPIIVVFLLFQVFSLKLNRRQLSRILVGIGYTFIGLVLFLTGVNVGFMPAGNYIGQMLAGLPYNWILIPIGMVIGYFIVTAEPAVHVLNKQVEEITSGAIPAKAMSLSLSVGVAVSLALAMIRVLTGIHIMWFIIPGYVFAIGLSFFVPKIFTSIAFDSGGVASGPMATTFLLPLAMGACEAVGGNVVSDAFGVVAMVAMTPLITIQILGAVYKIRLKRGKGGSADDMLPAAEGDDEIIE